MKITFKINKMKKSIKLFQKWNKSADRLEWSLTDVMSLLCLFYMFYFDRYYMSLFEEPKISIQFLFLQLIFLIAAFMPKYLKNLIDLKDKIK
jgi:hypothetical protein